MCECSVSVSGGLQKYFSTSDFHPFVSSETFVPDTVVDLPVPSTLPPLFKDSLKDPAQSLLMYQRSFLLVITYISRS